MFTSPHANQNDFQHLPPLPGVDVHLRDADFEANFRAFIDGELKGVRSSSLQQTWANFFMPVHGTTLDRALGIAEDRIIYSHRSLAELEHHVEQERLLNATDDLDMQIGMDQFVFTSVGRINPLDIQDVYFCFRSNLGEEKDSLVALREIVHFGALVSPEAARWRELALAPEKIDVAQINRIATVEFLQNVFRFEQFRDEIFPRFLMKHFGDALVQYCYRLEFPGTKPQLQLLGNTGTATNIWDGPQLCIPEQIDFARHEPSVLVVNEDRDARKRLEASGIAKERIFAMSEVLEEYESVFRRQGLNRKRDLYFFVNLALRDLALISFNNPAGESFPESMNGFRERVA